MGLIMKKVLALLVVAFPLFGFMFITGKVPSVATSYIDEVNCEDNAANTTVVNSGTGSNWTAGVNTSTITDAVNYKQGSRSFFLDASGEYAKGEDNVTSEYIRLEMWWMPNYETASGNEVIWSLGDGDALIEANEFRLQRNNGSEEFTFYGYGNTGDWGSKATTDFTAIGAADTWYKLRLTVDARSNDWTIAVAYSTNGTDFTDLTLEGSWSNATPQAAVFNNDLYFGWTSNVMNANVDQFTLEDLTP